MRPSPTITAAIAKPFEIVFEKVHMSGSTYGSVALSLQK
jgi:hypothetical protein